MEKTGSGVIWRGALGASVYDFRSTTAGTLIEVGTASAGGFGDRELSE
jgi:hypothetical protein